MNLVLLHGIGGGAAIWGLRGSGTLAALEAAGHRALALDLPGYGGSAGPTDMDAFVAAVAAAVASLPGQQAVLVGHSMGGMVAQEVLAREAARVDALVLLCTTAAFGKSDGSWQARFVAERLAPLEAGLGMAGMAAQLVPGLVGPRAGAAVQAAAREVMARVPEATYRAALETIVRFDRREALARIAVPTLVLAGEHDRTAPPEAMQRMAARIPGARYECLAEAGHIANLEQPVAFHAAVLTFLASMG